MTSTDNGSEHAIAGSRIPTVANAPAKERNMMSDSLTCP